MPRFSITKPSFSISSTADHNHPPMVATLLIPGLEPQLDQSAPADSYLLLVDLQAGTQRQILPFAVRALWNPTSHEFAYVDGNTLYVHRVDQGAQPEPLFTHDELSSAFMEWSPDGRQVAITTFHQGVAEPGVYPPIHDTIWLVAVDGGPTQELATVPARPIQDIPDELAWSSDSQALVFQGRVINLNGDSLDLNGEELDLGVGIVNDWLPTEQRLLVKTSAGLGLITPQGDWLETVSRTDVHTLSRAFSHDGTRLAYAEPDENGTNTLFIYDFATRTSSAIAEIPFNGGLGLLRWSAHDDALIFDNSGLGTPIWAVAAKPKSQVQVIVDDGFLVEAIDLTPSQASNK